MAVTRKVQKTKNNQYIITIPKTLVELVGISKGNKVDFEINNTNELILKIKKNQ